MLEGKTRIPPVDVETLPDDLRETLDEQRKLRGAPLYPYLFYARNPGVLPRGEGDVGRPATRDEARARDPPGAAQSARGLVERLRVLTGRQRCRGQQERPLDGENRSAHRLREELALHRRGEGGARIRRRDHGHAP